MITIKAYVQNSTIIFNYRLRSNNVSQDFNKHNVTHSPLKSSKNLTSANLKLKKNSLKNKLRPNLKLQLKMAPRLKMNLLIYHQTKTRKSRFQSRKNRILRIFKSSKKSRKPKTIRIIPECIPMIS